MQPRESPTAKPAIRLRWPSTASTAKQQRRPLLERPPAPMIPLRQLRPPPTQQQQPPMQEKQTALSTIASYPMREHHGRPPVPRGPSPVL